MPSTLAWSLGSTRTRNSHRTTLSERRQEILLIHGSFLMHHPLPLQAVKWCLFHRQPTWTNSNARQEVEVERPLLSGKLRLIGERNRKCFIHSIYQNRKISAHEFERGGLLKPIVNTIDGTPTFLSINSQGDSSTGSSQNQNGTTSSINRTQRLSRNELKHLDEKEMIFELVNDWKNCRLDRALINVESFRFVHRSRTFAMNSMSNRCVTKSYKTCRFC